MPGSGRHAGEPAPSFLIQFALTHPARIYAVASAALTLIAVYVPDIPQEAILTLVAALLGAGEVTQRIENGKTLHASVPNPAF
ncbi:hypothetical protein CTZ27_03220 [Streptomyces griseocarneus]|nr:hypothetical protein CTZ27_03220 [Streptomyces griseocarneus]